MIHERYLPLFKQLNDATTLEFEERHKEIIDKFDIHIVTTRWIVKRLTKKKRF